MAHNTPHGEPTRLRPNEIDRDRHLLADGRPKRILSLDGGGVRGVVSIGVLTAMEEILARRSPDPEAFRLCDYFDLIGGTSTGSIIATLLALGWKVSDVEKLYLRLAPEVFSTRGVIGIHKPKFDAKKLEEFISEITGRMEIESADLKTGLAMFTKRIDTGAQWVLSNHPDSKYWDADATSTYLPNKNYYVGDLIRASAAAPYFFDAEEIAISDTRGGVFQPDVGVFLDGAVAGANNPCVHLLTLATLGDYPFKWNVGAEQLFIVSVGTGAKRVTLLPREYQRRTFGGNLQKAVGALQGMITDTSQHAITTMQALSTPPGGDPTMRARINGEIGSMESAPLGGRALCTFLRLDASLEEDDVRPVIRSEYKSRRKLQKAIDKLPGIDNGDKRNLANLLRIGLSAGSELGDDHFPRSFDVSVVSTAPGAPPAQPVAGAPTTAVETAKAPANTETAADSDTNGNGQA